MKTLREEIMRLSINACAAAGVLHLVGDEEKIIEKFILQAIRLVLEREPSVAMCDAWYDAMQEICRRNDEAKILGGDSEWRFSYRAMTSELLKELEK